MLMEAKKHLKLMFISFKYNLQKEMINKTGFIMQVVFMMLNNSTFLVQWLILFSLKENIGGYGLDEVLIIWALAASTYGLSHTFFHNVYAIPNLITNGKLDVFLTQPKSVLFNISISSIKSSAIGDLLYGYLLVIIIRCNLYTLFMFTIFTITGGIILTSFSAIVGSYTFWLKKGDIITDNLETVAIVTATYPDGIFKGLVKALLYIMVPVGFMVFVPIKLIINFNLGLFLGVLVVTIIVTLGAFFLFNRGLRKYSSSNLMSARI